MQLRCLELDQVRSGHGPVGIIIGAGCETGLAMFHQSVPADPIQVI